MLENLIPKLSLNVELCRYSVKLDYMTLLAERNLID